MKHFLPFAAVGLLACIAPAQDLDAAPDVESRIQSKESEAIAVQTEMFERRRVLLAQNEEARQLANQIAELQAKITAILSADEGYAALRSRRQAIRKDLVALYAEGRQRTEPDQPDETAEDVAAPAVEPSPTIEQALPSLPATTPEPKKAP